MDRKQLADVARAAAHTTRPKLNKVACEQCWEETIRNDERLTANAAAARA